MELGQFQHDPNFFDNLKTSYVQFLHPYFSLFKLIVIIAYILANETTTKTKILIINCTRLPWRWAFNFLFKNYFCIATINFHLRLNKWRAVSQADFNIFRFWKISHINILKLHMISPKTFAIDIFGNINNIFLHIFSNYIIWQSS